MSNNPKQDEELLIELLAHFEKELPLAFEKGIISTADLSDDDRANCQIEMYEDLKKEGRLKYSH